MKLAVLIFFFLSGLSATENKVDPCDNLKVTAEITHTTNGLDNGVVEVKAEGGVEPYVFIFFNEKGNPLTLDYKSNKLSQLRSSNLFCTVIDKAGCQRKIEIDIK